MPLVRQLSCPLCREFCHSSDINYVKLGLGEGEEEEEEEVEVLGTHSSKILALTQTLLRIRRQDPGAKALVFSSVSWIPNREHQPSK